MDLSRIEWRKASYSSSNGGTCVEVAAARAAGRADMLCLVRDSKDPDGTRLSFTPQVWKAFTIRTKRAGAA